MAPIRIVVGIDGSRASERALTMAIRLAGRERGHVHACHVGHLVVPVAFGSFVVPVEDDLDATVERLDHVVGEALGQAEVCGDFSWRRGEVAPELERAAADHEAELLVVGRSAHPHFHVGNVPSRLIAMGRRSVLVVP